MDQLNEKSVFDDLSQLEKTLTDDHSGQRARAMLDYFEQVSQTSEKMVPGLGIGTERQMVGNLVEGFRASARIIQHVWEKIHGMTLPL